MNRIEPITGVIKSAQIAGAIEPGNPYPFADQISYTMDINLPESMASNVPGNRPHIERWPRPIRVHPMRVGTVVGGYRVGDRIQWDFRELPDFGDCI